MDWLSIPQAAKKVKKSKQAIYMRLKKLTQQERKKLAGHLDETGVLRLSDKGLQILFGQSTEVNQPGKHSQDEIVGELRIRLVEKDDEVKRLDGFVSNLLTQLDDERKLRLEEQRHWSEERNRTDTIIMKLTNDVGHLQKRLEYRIVTEREILNKPPAPVKPWNPPERVDPFVGESWFHRIFASLFYPERLRSGTN